MGIFEDICDRPWDYYVKPFRVAGKVYYVGNTWVAIYLIDTGDGLILIDTAMPQTVYLTLENIRLLGFDPKDIKYILISHAHYDHCGGVAPIANYTGAKVFMGKEDLFYLTERQDLIIIYKDTFQPFKVDYFYDENKPVTLGDFSIETRHTPGHTPGTYSYFFNVEEDGKQYRCGMHGGIGVNTLTDEFLETYGQPKSLREDFRKSLEGLRDEKVDITLGSHVNHADMLNRAALIGKGRNPFIDPLSFGRLIDSRMDDFRKIVGE